MSAQSDCDDCDISNSGELLLCPLHKSAPELLAVLQNMNHMGGDERGGYCICPLNDGSAPLSKHATICQDAQKAIKKSNGGFPS